MATLNEQLKIKTGYGEEYNFGITERYSEVFSLMQEVDNSDAFITLVSISTAIGSNNLSDAKSMVIKNNGTVASEIQLKITDYRDSSDTDVANSVDLGPGSNTTTRQVSFLLAAGEYILLPNVRWVSYAEDTSAGNGTPATAGTYLSLEVAEHKDLTAYVDGSGIASGTTATTFDVDDNAGSPAAAVGYFRVGDLIRIEDEIMEVTAIADNTGTEAQLTVKRGMYGSTAATHADNEQISLPFFNAYADFDRYTLAQTDTSGRFKAFNFFGFARNNTTVSDGIVPGSIAGKFYIPGYQELGMSGLSNSSDSGLSANTEYAFDVTVDGGSAYNVQFTVDTTNTKLGGTNGVLSKINTVFNNAYTSAGNLKGKRVQVSIRNGDLRFTSGQSISTSAVALAVKSAGDNEFFGSGVIPAIGTSGGEEVGAAVGALLPPDTIIDKKGLTVPNKAVFFYDDGHGRISGRARGTINYNTGKLDLKGPPNAEFTITATYNSAHSGGIRTDADAQNTITEVSARSCNSKINTNIQIIAFN